MPGRKGSSGSNYAKGEPPNRTKTNKRNLKLTRPYSKSNPKPKKEGRPYKGSKPPAMKKVARKSSKGR